MKENIGVLTSRKKGGIGGAGNNVPSESESPV